MKKKSNKGLLSFNVELTLSFEKSNWTIKGCKEYLKRTAPYGATNWKRIHLYCNYYVFVSSKHVTWR